MPQSRRFALRSSSGARCMSVFPQDWSHLLPGAGAPRKASFPAPFALGPNAKVLDRRRGLEGTDLGQALIAMLRGGALGVDSPCARKTVGSPQQFGSENRPVVAVIQLCTAR